MTVGLGMKKMLLSNSGLGLKYSLYLQKNNILKCRKTFFTRCIIKKNFCCFDVKNCVQITYVPNSWLFVAMVNCNSIWAEP